MMKESFQDFTHLLRRYSLLCCEQMLGKHTQSSNEGGFQGTEVWEDWGVCFGSHMSNEASIQETHAKLTEPALLKTRQAATQPLPLQPEPLSSTEVGILYSDGDFE